VNLFKLSVLSKILFLKRLKPKPKIQQSGERPIAIELKQAPRIQEARAHGPELRRLSHSDGNMDGDDLD
jgi:hypothetical protein